MSPLKLNRDIPCCRQEIKRVHAKAKRCWLNSLNIHPSVEFAFRNVSVPSIVIEPLVLSRAGNSTTGFYSKRRKRAILAELRHIAHLIRFRYKSTCRRWLSSSSRTGYKSCRRGWWWFDVLGRRGTGRRLGTSGFGGGNLAPADRTENYMLRAWVSILSFAWKSGYITSIMRRNSSIIRGTRMCRRRELEIPSSIVLHNCRVPLALGNINSEWYKQWSKISFIVGAIISNLWQSFLQCDVY